MTSARTLPSLDNPFPIPQVHVVTVPNVKPLGISFVGHVSVGRLLDPSAFAGTAIAAGQKVVSVNGKSVTTPKEAVEALTNEKGSEITLVTTASSLLPLYGKFVSVPFSRLHPGLRLEEQHGMVVVDRIYEKGNYTVSNLRVGDVVLAVNDTPVDTVEAARRLLKQPHAYTVLYLLDMEALRASVVSTLKQDMPKYKLFEMPDRPGHYGLAFEEKRHLVSNLTLQELRLCKPQEHLQIAVNRHTDFQTAGVHYSRDYQKALTYLNAYNRRLDQMLDALQEAVAVATWRHESNAPVEETGQLPVAVAIVETNPFE